MLNISVTGMGWYVELLFFNTYYRAFHVGGGQTGVQAPQRPPQSGKSRPPQMTVPPSPPKMGGRTRSIQIKENAFFLKNKHFVNYKCYLSKSKAIFLKKCLFLLRKKAFFLKALYYSVVQSMLCSLFESYPYDFLK